MLEDETTDLQIILLTIFLLQESEELHDFWLIDCSDFMSTIHQHELK